VLGRQVLEGVRGQLPGEDAKQDGLLLDGKPLDQIGDLLRVPSREPVPDRGKVAPPERLLDLGARSQKVLRGHGPPLEFPSP